MSHPEGWLFFLMQGPRHTTHGEKLDI